MDMLCWVAFCSRLLGRLAARLEMAEEAAAYEAAHAQQLDALLAHHWNEKLQAFNDWGLQACAPELDEKVAPGSEEEELGIFNNDEDQFQS